MPPIRVGRSKMAHSLQQDDQDFGVKAFRGHDLDFPASFRRRIQLFPLGICKDLAVGRNGRGVICEW